MKLLYIVVNVALISVLAAALLQLVYQRQQLIQNARASAATLNDTIEASLEHAMLSGEWRLVDEVIQVVASEGGVDALRIINKQGRIGWSSIPGEVGIEKRLSDVECRVCHATQNEGLMQSSLYSIPGRDQMLINVKPIQNRAECLACHQANVQVLGLLFSETSLAGVNRQVQAGFLRTGLIALAALGLQLSLIVPALNRAVLRPVEALSRGVAEISAGNLTHHVQVATQDELGLLASAFNAMRTQLLASQAAREQHEQELAILNEIGLAATQLLDIESILDLAQDVMVNKLGMANSMIYLRNKRSGHYCLKASHGLTAAQRAEISRRRKEVSDITQEVVETGREVFIPNMADDDRFYGVWDKLEGRSYIKLPLIARGMVVGVLGLVTQAGQSLTVREVEFLKAVGRELGIAIDNARLLSETRQGEAQAVTLYKLGTQISASLALKQVVHVVAEAARELLEADIGLVGLVDDVGQDVIIQAAAGTQANQLAGIRLPVHSASSGRLLAKGQSLIAELDDGCHEDYLAIFCQNNEQVVSLLAAPLMRGDNFLGIIEVLTRQPRRFNELESQLLLRLAQQVVISIENAQLHRKLRQMATLEERDRLARELHDHLAQGLGYLKVRTSMADELLAEGQITAAQENLQEIKKAAQVLYTDVREEIFNLRTAASERIGFFATLQEYLEEYHNHYGLTVHLIVQNEELSDISPEVTSQLLRIIQEALTNVRRHSNARIVHIYFQQVQDLMYICIEDDGQGFEPEAATQDHEQHYGLQIMQERALSVGGNLNIDSQPGRGTRVLIQVPIIY